MFIGALTFVVHDVGYLLRQPFWVDEAWVAVSTRVGIRAVPRVSSVSPLGWTLLLRTMVFGVEQRLRYLPLIFSALAVVAAYAFVRLLPWRMVGWSRIAASVAAAAVLLAPSSLLRNDLKQYTADACVTLIVLTLVALLEREWSRRTLAALAVACVLLFSVSTISLFVGLAAFASLLARCWIRRDRARAVEATVAGLASGLGLGLLFLVLYAPHVKASLTDYWSAYHLPVSKGVGPTLHFLHIRAGQMADYLGMGPLLLALVLIAAGIVTLARMGRPALACLLVEMFVLSAAKKYPLFDMRTSHFLTVMFAVYAVIGVVGLAS